MAFLSCDFLKAFLHTERNVASFYAENDYITYTYMQNKIAHISQYE